MFVPEDLEAALSQSPDAHARFNELSEQMKYLHVRLVSEVADRELRNERINEVVSLLVSH